MKKLNLGSGHDNKKGWVNLDYNPDYNPDVVHDLNKFPYPFKDGEFDYIYCSHILEHVDDFFKTMKELVRILKPNGRLHIRVPHFSNGLGYSDLTHKRFFGWNTFKYYTINYYPDKCNFKIIKQRYNWLGEGRKIANKLFSWGFNLIPKSFYERFLCWIFPVGEIEVWLRKN